MGMTRSADFYSPLPGSERIASTDRSARSTANRSTIDFRNSHTAPTSSLLLPTSSASSSSSIGSPSALLLPSSPSSSSSSSSSSLSTFLRHRQEGGRLLLDPLPLHGGETKRAELPEVVLTEVAQLVGHPNTARVLLHNTNKSSYTHLPLPSFSTGNSTVSTGFQAENLPERLSTSTSTASSIVSSRLGDHVDENAEIRRCKSNSHSSGRPAHLVSLSSSGTELHHVGTKHSSHIPLPLSRTPSPSEEREGSAKFGLSDSYSPDCSPPGSPNLNQNRRLSEPCSSLSPLPSPRTSQNMSLSRSPTIDLTEEEDSNDNEDSKKRSSHSIGFICNNNNMDVSSDSDSSPSMSPKNNNNSLINNNNNNRSAAPQTNANVRGGYFLTVISGGSLPGETESRQTIRVGPGPWKVAVVPVCPIARARLLRRRALLAARFGNTGGNSSPPSTAEQQEREHHSRSLQQKQQQIQSHHHHHRHFHHFHNQPSHHPQCQHHQNALLRQQQHQQQQQQEQQQQCVQRSPMAKRSSLSQVQSLRLPSRHNNGVPPVVQNIKSLSRSREIELKKSLLHQQHQQQQRQRLSQSGTLEVLANAVTDLNMHESKLS